MLHDVTTNHPRTEPVSQWTMLFEFYAEEPTNSLRLKTICLKFEIDMQISIDLKFIFEVLNPTIKAFNR